MYKNNQFKLKIKIELKWNKIEEIEEEENADDWCSPDILLGRVLSPFNGLNQSGYWSFFSSKGFIFFPFLRDKNKKKVLKIFSFGFLWLKTGD